MIFLRVLTRLRSYKAAAPRLGGCQLKGVAESNWLAVSLPFGLMDSQPASILFVVTLCSYGSEAFALGDTSKRWLERNFRYFCGFHVQAERPCLIYAVGSSSGFA